ncbi:MAG: hypothetical protein JW885_05925 [Deltaproteobacteria bacterium]|nr:hypothetical protein [Candidatus Zymogenaceae bacterium]
MQRTKDAGLLIFGLWLALYGIQGFLLAIYLTFPDLTTFRELVKYFFVIMSIPLGNTGQFIIGVFILARMWKVSGAEKVAMLFLSLWLINGLFNSLIFDNYTAGKITYYTSKILGPVAGVLLLNNFHERKMTERVGRILLAVCFFYSFLRAGINLFFPEINFNTISMFVYVFYIVSGILLMTSESPSPDQETIKQIET